MWISCGQKMTLYLSTDRTQLIPTLTGGLLATIFERNTLILLLKN